MTQNAHYTSDYPRVNQVSLFSHFLLYLSVLHIEARMAPVIHTAQQLLHFGSISKV